MRHELCCYTKAIYKETRSFTFKKEFLENIQDIPCSTDYNMSTVDIYKYILAHFI